MPHSMAVGRGPGGMTWPLSVPGLPAGFLRVSHFSVPHPHPLPDLVFPAQAVRKSASQGLELSS